MKQGILVLTLVGCLTGCFAGENRRITREELSALLELGDELVRVLDFRSDFDRDAEGYIPGSELVDANKMLTGDLPEEDVPKPIEEDDRLVVIVTMPRRSRELEVVLTRLGFDRFRCYVDGLMKWKEAGNEVEYPRFIKFRALRYLLATPERHPDFLLIDVRNRTELNTVGRIPGSVNFPLHEISNALDLTDEEFKEIYGFDLPSETAKNVVLTCRSGRRVLVADRIMKRKRNFQNLRIYSGSFKDWVARRGITDFADYDVDY